MNSHNSAWWVVVLPSQPLLLQLKKRRDRRSTIFPRATETTGPDRGLEPRKSGSRVHLLLCLLPRGLSLQKASGSRLPPSARPRSGGMAQGEGQDFRFSFQAWPLVCLAAVPTGPHLPPLPPGLLPWPFGTNCLHHIMSPWEPVLASHCSAQLAIIHHPGLQLSALHN